MFLQVLATEFMKLRRARVPGATLLALMTGVLGLALMLWIVKEPGRAAELGLLGTKADLSGLEATWESFAAFLMQIVGTGGMLILVFVIAYLFGREYDEGTAKNMLALPVARHWFVVAKLVVGAVWWFAIVLGMLVWAVVVGLAMQLPGFSAEVVWGLFANTLLAASISLLLAPVFAFVTVWSRGFMGPLGFAIGALLMGNLLGNTGWAPWFPWSIVPILVGSVGEPVAELPVGSYVVVALTFVAGVAATIAMLRGSDLAQ